MENVPGGQEVEVEVEVEVKVEEVMPDVPEGRALGGRPQPQEPAGWRIGTFSRLNTFVTAIMRSRLESPLSS